MTRPARALIDAQALRHNLERVRALAPGCRVMAVVKADGYGHGLARVARILLEAQAFAVASFEEGVVLRNAGVAHPIFLLQGFYDGEELAELGHHRFSPVVHHETQLAALENTRQAGPIDVWLKVDTGMHRIGFPAQQASAVFKRLAACSVVHRVRLMSHLANADDISDETTRQQIERFNALSAGLEAERSLANSAGVVGWPESHFDWVRPGIMLYGVSPIAGRTAAELGLEPVMTLASRVIAVNRCRRGARVGYGGEFVCPEDMTVGVVAIGYGDGYPRHARTATPVLVNGARAALVGRVSMDMITVDLRAHASAAVGDPVVLWGKGLPVEEVAQCAGTIGYELLARMPARVPRVETS